MRWILLSGLFLYITGRLSRTTGSKIRPLLSSPNAGSQAITEVIYSGGLRISEALGLDYPDLDMIGMTIKVRGKGAKERLSALGGTGRQGVAALS